MTFKLNADGAFEHYPVVQACGCVTCACRSCLTEARSRTVNEVLDAIRQRTREIAEIDEAVRFFDTNRRDIKRETLPREFDRLVKLRTKQLRTRARTVDLVGMLKDSLARLLQHKHEEGASR